ncbi:probable cystatin-15 [Talpa occidentalis]|uniref:probable cystatin-15 n=1 Tax=Talpa occidentalis TaxID=50954 RepID=UPI00188E9251|nr:probable cystatin-15 [Talpa occidentalis]
MLTCSAAVDSMFPKSILILGLIVLGLHACTCKFVDIAKSTTYFTLCVEFAVFQYNEAQPDEFAYKLLWVRRSQQKILSWTYLMDLDMGRTICKKHDEDINNCHLQEGPGKKTVSCTFVVNIIPVPIHFTLLNSTCLRMKIREDPVFSQETDFFYYGD